jgi:hypothetical protein
MKPVLKTQKLVLPQVQRYLPWAKRSLFILGFSLITLGVNQYCSQITRVQRL